MQAVHDDTRADNRWRILDDEGEEVFAWHASFGIDTPEQALAQYAVVLDETENPPTESPVRTPPSRAACALRITVAGGDISSVEGAFNVAAAIYLDVGVYMIIFYDYLPNANYFVELNDEGAAMTASDLATDSFVVYAKNAFDGSAADPPSFSVNIWSL